MVIPPKAWERPTIATYLSDVVGKLQKDGTMDVVKNRRGLTRQRLNKEDFFNLSDGDVLTDGENYYICNGTVTGRIQAKMPNILNIRRDYSTEHKFEQCRLREKKFGHRICDRCNQRFQCWTAGKPAIQFTELELDYTQTSLRIQNVIEAMNSVGFLAKDMDNVLKQFVQSE